MSALARDADGALLGLLSGHGTLRSTDDGFEAGPWPEGDEPWATLVDDDQAPYAAQLLDGAVTPRMDFAIGRVADIDGDEVVLGHRLRGLPIPVRNGRPAVGEELKHFSPKRGRVVRGEVVQHALAGALHDGVGIEIHGAIVIRSVDAEAFSIVTDSGSLVFDAESNAVGFVVAGSANDSVSYVLPINGALQKRLERRFKLFFEVKANS
jgi:hypothetical protein